VIKQPQINNELENINIPNFVGNGVVLKNDGFVIINNHSIRTYKLAYRKVTTKVLFQSNFGELLDFLVEKPHMNNPDIITRIDNI